MNPSRSGSVPEPNLQAEFRKLGMVATVMLVAGLALAIGIGRSLSGSLAGETNPTYILWPAFAMFLLVAGVLTWMGISRIGSILGGRMDIRFYRTYDAGEEPERLRVITRQFINLFEMPVLFYVALVIAHITHHVTGLLVGLAWSYVALRYVHCIIHLSVNDVAVRLSAFAASGLVLLVFWVTLFAELAG